MLSSAFRERAFCLAVAPIAALLALTQPARAEAAWATEPHAPTLTTPAELAMRAIGVSFRGGLADALALIAVVLIAGAALVLTGKKRPPEPATNEARAPLSLLAKLLGGAFVFVAVFVVSRFRYLEDDFFQLMRALDRPWEMDDSLRLVSGALLYGIGIRVGIGWFMAVGAIVWIGSAVMLFHLFRRAGHDRDEALVAASIAGLAPGYFLLFRSAIGFQPSASIALHYAILLLVDAAARTRLDERARRVGFLLLALGITSFGVFVKYPMMAVVPILAWIWGKRIVREAPSPLSAHTFYASFAAAIAVPLALTHSIDSHSGELDKAGLALLANLGTAWRLLRPGLVRLAFGAAVLYVGAELLDGRGFLRRALAALRADLRAFARPDRNLSTLALLALVTLAPFLLNGRYFAPYYVVACSAWIAAIAALPLAFAARRLDARGRIGVLVTLFAAAQILPTEDLMKVRDTSIANDPTPLVDAVRRATAGLPAPCGLRLEVSCPTPEATAASLDDLRQLDAVTEHDRALRWATGWHEIDIDLAGRERRSEMPAGCAPLVLHHCRGRGVWVDEARP
ncbi:Hypothetical protein A7982_08221 [Minicystis rosea]|nr:Hypothetical protein A7982_08221 [Minicystis rosea]